MTCNEIARKERAGKNEKDDIYLQKCRKRYKNLHKQVSIGASEKVENLFGLFKEQYPIYQKIYKDGYITGDELLQWLECMKLKNKVEIKFLYSLISTFKPFMIFYSHVIYSNFYI